MGALNQTSSLSSDETELLSRIEQKRESLLACNDLLDDGSLAEPGLYDTGVSVGQACEVSKKPRPSLMLYSLVRALKPQCVIELGTNVGISSAFIAAALKANGAITTLDASPYRQKVARNIHSELGFDNVNYKQGLFDDTLADTLRNLGKVDLAFIDGHHQYQPTLDYFEDILRFSSPNAVFVFDDIRWSAGMSKAWSALQNDKRLGVVIDLYSMGICVRASESISQRYVFRPIYSALR